MTICLTLSMLAAYYGITIYKNIYYEYQDKNNYKYGSETSFMYQSESVGVFPALPENCPANLKLVNCSAYADALSATIVIDVVLHSYEENYPLLWGHYPNIDEQTQEPVIVLGKERAEYAYERSGSRYFQLFGEEYRVVGVIGAENSMLFDGKVLVYEKNMGDKLRSYINSDSEFGYLMKLESNAADTHVLYDTYMGDYVTSISPGETDYSDSTANPIYNEKLYCTIIFVFCFICIAVAFRYWLEQRMQEMQVCRACGYTNKKLLGRILLSFLRLCVLAFFVSVIVVCGLNVFLGRLVDTYRLGFSATVILPYVGVFLLAFLCVCAVPMHRALNNSIAGVLSDRE